MSTTASATAMWSSSRTDTTNSKSPTSSTDSSSAWIDMPAGRALVWASARVMNAAICPRVTSMSGANFVPSLSAVPLAMPSS